MGQLREDMGQAVGALDDKSSNEITLLRSDIQDTLQGPREDNQQSMEALAQMISAATATSSPQLKTALEDEPKYEDQENAEAAAALMEAKSVFMFGSESVESDVIAQINLRSADPATFLRYKEKFSDIRAFTENAIKEDPSIETELTAALNKNGHEKANALNSLAARLGPKSHRQPIVGNAMMYYLLTRSSALTKVKNCAVATTRDFLIQGHGELQKFFSRCKEGQTLLLSEFSATDRSAYITRGLSAIQQSVYFESLVVGIITKLGYSAKPSCDIQALLDQFKNLRQHGNETAHDWSNRFSNHLVSLQDATSLLGKAGRMPNEGDQLIQFKKGCKQELREKANHILQNIWLIPLGDATFNNLSQAMLKAEVMMAEIDADEKTTKPQAAAKNPPVPSASAPAPAPHQDGTHPLNPQDPALTQKLKGVKICANFVAEQLGKSGKPCSKQDTAEGCPYFHYLPSVAGLKDEDYKDFKVIPAHLMMAVIKLPGADPKMLTLPPSVSCPAIAEGGDQTKQQTDSTAAAGQETKEPNVAVPCLMGAPLIGMSTMRATPPPAFMRGAVNMPAVTFASEKKAKEPSAIAATVLQNSSFPYFMRGSTAC